MSPTGSSSVVSGTPPLEEELRGASLERKKSVTNLDVLLPGNSTPMNHMRRCPFRLSACLSDAKLWHDVTIRPEGPQEMAEKVMDIVFVSSEVAPYSKTGGLADVAGSLPHFPCCIEGTA